MVCIDGGCVLPANPGCSQPEPPIKGDTIVFGAVQNLSGAFNQDSLNQQLAMRLAVATVNESGALGDRQLSMIWCDSHREDTVAAQAIRYLVDRKNVPAVVGIETSNLVLTNGEYVSDRGAILMSHASTAPAVTRFQLRPDKPTLVWRTSPSDVYQSQALAEVVRKGCVKPERVFVLFHDDGYGRGLADGFQGELCGGEGQGPGGSCLHDRRALPDNQPLEVGGRRESLEERDARVEADTQQLVADVLEQRNFIDVLAVFGFPDHAAALFRQLAAQGGNPDFTILAGEAILTHAILASPEVRQLGLTIVGADPGLSRGRSFRAFEKAFIAASERDAEGAPPLRPAAFAAHAYDSVVALALAAATAPAGRPPTGDELAHGLGRLADLDGPRFGVDRLVEAAAALKSAPGAGINYQGASGDLDFDPAIGEAPGTSISPTLALPDGRVCPATDLGIRCASADVPSCRPPCTAPFPSVSAAQGAEPLLLGGLLAMTGPNTELGRSRRQAMELALDRLNSPGVGRPVQMVLCDVETAVDLALSRADEVVEERGATALIGPSTSAQSIEVGAYAARSGVLMVTPSATSADVTPTAPTGAGGQRLVWRTAPSDAEQARALAEFISGADCIDNLGVVYRNDVYGKGLRSGFVAAACPGGTCRFELTPQVLPALGAPAEFETLARALSEADPALDAVLLLSFRGEGVDLLTALAATEFDRPVVVSETMIAQEVATDEALARFEIVGTNPGLSQGPAWSEFDLDYRAEYPGEKPDTFAAATFDAVIMVGLAAATLPSDTPPTGPALSAGLTRLSGGDRAFHPGELAGATAALSAGPDARIDYSGASGALDLDPATGQAPADIALYRIGGGTLSPLLLDPAQPHPLCD